jgi:16S rRNA processing protein RimM
MGRLAIGKIKKSHGVRGFFKVYSYSGETQHFADLKEVFLLLDGRQIPYRVEAVLSDASGVRLKLEGIDTPEEIKRLTGAEIWVESQWAAPLGEGEYYLSDLSRCRVVQEGKEIGPVAGLLEGNGEIFLEVSTESGKKLLIPFREAFIGDINIKEGVISLTEVYTVD